MKLRYSVLILFASLVMAADLYAAAKKKSSPRPYVWVIDPGHGGSVPGTLAAGEPEKTINLRIAKELQKLLEKNKPGIMVKMTRTTDRNMSVAERVKFANNAGADLFVSIHANYVPKRPSVHGTETFYAKVSLFTDKKLCANLRATTERSQLLAWLIERNYRLGGRPSDRGVKGAGKYVTVYTNMPAVLTEVGFASNPEEGAFIKSEEGARHIATCIYNALAEYHLALQEGSVSKTLKKLRATRGRESGLKATLLPMPNDKNAAPVVTPQTPATPKAEDAVNPGGKDMQANDAIPSPQTPVQQTSSGADSIAQVTPPEGRLTAGDEPLETQQSNMQQQTAEDTNNPVTTTPAKPTYHVQLFAVGREITEGDKSLKGLRPITVIKVDGKNKVLYGSTTDYREASRILASIRTLFPDAFIVAFLGDKQISTAEAIKMK